MLVSFVLGDVVYNAEFPFTAPDVIFGPEDEDFNSFLVTGGDGGEGGLNSLKNVLSDWNNRDPSRLLALIKELRLGF